MKRNGKIARLPEEIREQLNTRLENDESGQPLLDWLNGQPETVKLVKADFDGAPINKQNLSEWRKGGYAEWVLRRSLLESAQTLSSRANEVQEIIGECLVDDLAVELATRYAALLANWDGKPSAEFEAQVRVLRILCHDVVQLQRATHAAIARRDAQDKQAEQEGEEEFRRAKSRALAPLREALHRHMSGGYKQPEDKFMAIVRALDNDLPIPDFGEPAEKSQTESNQVKVAETA